MDRINSRLIASALRVAVASTGLPLQVDSHGTIGNRAGYSVEGPCGRIGGIGSKQETYRLLHAIADCAWALRDRLDTDTPAGRLAKASLTEHAEPITWTYITSTKGAQ